MKLGTEYTSPLSQIMSSATPGDRWLSANRSQAQAKIFPETGAGAGAAHQFAMAPHDEAVAPPIRTTPHPRSRARGRTANTGQRDKRGAVLGTCSTSEFRECRGGEALKDGSSIYIRFDQNRHKETRGADGRGTCQGIVREAIRRIDRSYNDRPRLTALSAVITMRDDMSTSANARRSGIYDNIATFQDNRHALALRNYDQSRDMSFSPNDALSREDQLRGLMEGLNAMSPGAFAFIGAAIQSAGAASQREGGHALLIQRRPDLPAPNGIPRPHRYTIFDPNNGAFDYATSGAMNNALQNYMNTAYSENGGIVTPERALFYAPRTPDARQRPLSATLVPPSPQLPEPPGFMQPDAGPSYSHTELKKRSPPPPNSGQEPRRNPG